MKTYRIKKTYSINPFIHTVCFKVCVDFFIYLLIFVIVNSISRLSNLYLSRSIHIKKLPKTTNLSINFIWPLNIYISGLCVHIAKYRDHNDKNIQRKQYNNQQRLIYNWSHIEEDKDTSIVTYKKTIEKVPYIKNIFD